MARTKGKVKTFNAKLKKTKKGRAILRARAETRRRGRELASKRGAVQNINNLTALLGEVITLREPTKRGMTTRVPKPLGPKRFGARSRGALRGVNISQLGLTTSRMPRVRRVTVPAAAVPTPTTEYVQTLPPAAPQPPLVTFGGPGGPDPFTFDNMRSALFDVGVEPSRRFGLPTARPIPYRRRSPSPKGNARVLGRKRNNNTENMNNWK
jgi:hypothetical protein